MLGQIVEFCGSYQGQLWITLWSDAAIAIAYFAIPITMLVVLRDRRHDIPYPWLWSLFVTFIVACGLTHVVHVWSALAGAEHPALQASIGVITALASVATALAFALILPQIKMMPSPRERQRHLEQLVRERTREKDKLIMEINHRLGNQLQVLSSIVSVELRRAKAGETAEVLERFKQELNDMGEKHIRMSAHDYLATDAGQAGAASIAAEPQPVRRKS